MNNISEENIGLLFDATRCIGCMECVRACKKENDLPSTIESDLSSASYTVVYNKAGQYIRKLCMHCSNPTCVSVCPVAALRREKNGQVTYNVDACMGCRYCVFACPFNVPRFEWDKPVPLIRKCDFCFKRTSKGGETVCSWVCPMGATISGTRKDLLTEAKARIAQEPDRYVDHVYGEYEVGGTSVLILSGIPINQTGYSNNISTTPLPELTWRVLEKLPFLIINAGILLGGISWIIRRRILFEKHPELREDDPEEKE